MSDDAGRPDPEVPETEVPEAEPLDGDGDPLGELIAAVDEEIAAAGTGPARSAAPSAARGRQHLLFSLAGGRWAVPLEHLAEIGLPPPITAVPNVPPWVHGVANLRGDVLAVLDPAELFGLAAADDVRPAHMLVIRGGTPEEIAAGLLIDRVHGLIGLGELGSPTAEVTDRVAPFLAGVAEHEDRLVAVLDVERFFASPDVRRFEAL